ncbi:hypothetical protein HC864_01850 [Candidatus Gracilibacteria bacterium]|nr:hypothetical protein [Candidatus Gracilibacteria bacterium]
MSFYVGFVDLGGGYFQVKSFFYPKYCLSTSSGALTVMFTCNSGDPNQRFRVTTDTIVSTPIVDYEAWLIARKQNVSNDIGQVGHTWVAIVRRNYEKVDTYRDNQLINSFLTDGEWSTEKTYSLWPSDCFENCDSDPFLTTQIITDDLVINSSQSTFNYGYAVRKAKISGAKYAWINNNGQFETGCNHYVWPFGSNPNPIGACTCVDKATRLWKNTTGEDFTNTISNGEWPTDRVMYDINVRNLDENSNGYANQGQIYQ